MKPNIFLFFFLLISFSAKSQLLYSNTIETGNRYNPGLSQNNSPKVAFDDVLVPSSIVAGSDSICITKVKLGIRRIAGAGATDVKIYYTRYDDTSTQVGSKIKIPPVLLGTVSLPANPASTFTQIISVGDSITPIFKAKTDTGSAYTGYQTFFIGVAFTNSDANNGVRLTNTFSTYNDDAIWLFNADSSVPRYATNFGSNPIATFYIQLFGYKQNAVVPVSIANFYAKKEDGYNRLFWSTLTEINNLGFNLQRSKDGVNFKIIDFIPSSALNNTSSRIDYTYKDLQPLKDTNYYRLQQLDKDGRIAYSDIIFLKASEANDLDFLGVYPNPVLDNVNIHLYSNAQGKSCLISLYDLTGKKVFTKFYSLLQGSNKLSFKLDKKNSGLLQLVIESSKTRINKTILIAD